jgi:hypothetical protein
MQTPWTVLGVLRHRCTSPKNWRPPWRARSRSRSESVGPKRYRFWEPQDCCRWRAAHPRDQPRICLSSKDRSPTNSPSTKKKSGTSAWRPSTFSTRRTPDRFGPMFTLSGAVLVVAEVVAAAAVVAAAEAAPEAAAAEAAAAEAAASVAADAGAAAAAAVACPGVAATSAKTSTTHCGNGITAWPGLTNPAMAF